MDCETLTRDVLRRLGDGTDVPELHRLWQDEEIRDYIRDGYYELCLRTEALWDQWYLDNLPFAANCDFSWEEGFITSSTGPAGAKGRRFRHHRGIRFGFSNRNFDWERAYASGSDNPANHNFPLEWPYLLTDYCSGVVTLPEHLYQVDRATQDSCRVLATRSSELEYADPLYEETRGTVDAYAQDKDGARVLRKYRLPVSRASTYTALGYGLPRGVIAEDLAGLFRMHLDEWAMAEGAGLDVVLGLSLFQDFVPYVGAATAGEEWTSLPEFSDCTVLGAWGVLRRLPNYHPIFGYLGGVRRFHLETNNFKVEGHRRGHRLDDRTSLFEIPDHYLIYIRHYAMSHALSRDGEGQDLDLAQHYQARFEAGVARIKTRLERMQSQRMRTLGESVPQGRIAFAQPPWNLERI